MTVSDAEIARLAASYDIIDLGMRADEVRRRHHDNRTTFVRVADVPIERPDVEWPAAAREIRIVGTPATRSAAVEAINSVAVRARTVPLSGFSLADLDELAARDQQPLRSLLAELRGAGLELIAEAPVDRLRDPRLALEAVRAAGLRLARLTIDRLPSADVPSLFRRVADLQDAAGDIRAFAPLPRRINPSVPTTGYDDVKRVALARLMLDGIDSIQVDWKLYGPKLAQVALTVGADDVDGVSPEEDSGQGRRRAPLEEILRNIRAAGFEPVERDGRFEPVAAAAAVTSAGAHAEPST